MDKKQDLIKILKKYRITDGVLLLLLFVYFRNSVLWIAESFTNKDSYEFGILFIVLCLILTGYIRYKRKELSEYLNSGLSLIPLICFSSAFFIDILNSLVLHFNIVSGIAFFIGIYGYIGFYLRWDIWKRGLYILGIFIFTLPISYHIQTYLGFPLRIFTAKLVSWLLQLFGASSFNEAAVIITENNATTVDLPCSGIKSLYTGAILMFIIYFLKRIRFSYKLVLVTLAYFFSLIFFNFWRVYILVYIYDIVKLKEVGDLIHISLGIFGFLISGIILWVLTEKFLLKSSQKISRILKPICENIKYYLIIVLCSLIIFDFIYISHIKQSQEKNFRYNEIQISLENADLVKEEFSDKESGFFINRDVDYSGKFEGNTKNNIPFSLLIVASRSVRTHHNPEICMQGLGYSIDHSEIFKINDINIRKAILNKGSASVIYWFTNGYESLTDYSERVWHGIIEPGEQWVLIEIGFNFNIDVYEDDVVQLVTEINNNLFSDVESDNI